MKETVKQVYTIVRVPVILQDFFQSIDVVLTLIDEIRSAVYGLVKDHKQRINIVVGKYRGCCPKEQQE